MPFLLSNSYSHCTQLIDKPCMKLCVLGHKFTALPPQLTQQTELSNGKTVFDFRQQQMKRKEGLETRRDIDSKQKESLIIIKFKCFWFVARVSGRPLKGTHACEYATISITVFIFELSPLSLYGNEGNKFHAHMRAQHMSVPLMAGRNCQLQYVKG